MKSDSKNNLKEKLIKRILNYTFIYNETDLRNQSFMQLIKLHKTLFIDLTIRSKFKNRHKI